MKYLIVMSGQIADGSNREQDALDAAEELREMYPKENVHIYTLSSTFFAGKK